MESSYELISDRLSEAEWRQFTKKMVFGFKGFPPEWELDEALRFRLLLRLQWEYYNPDAVEAASEKRSRSWAFVSSFLGEGFKRKFAFLRQRLDEKQKEKWDLDFAQFENLLLLSSMPDEMQEQWLGSFEAKIRHGAANRAKVIKNKGLGLQSELLGVNVLMEWAEIKARYRYLLKRHHPDLGGDPALTVALIEEYNRLEKAAAMRACP